MIIKNIKKKLYLKRRIRVRKKIIGSFKKPRLSIFKTSKHLYVQAIDDLSHRTLVSSSTLDKEIIPRIVGCKQSEKAKVIGFFIAKKLINHGIKFAVFDRKGFSYQGNVGIIADSARSLGLLF